jgi:hypothetical protein
MIEKIEKLLCGLSSSFSLFILIKISKSRPLYIKNCDGIIMMVEADLQTSIIEMALVSYVFVSTQKMKQ